MATRIPVHCPPHAVQGRAQQQSAYDRQEARRKDNNFYCSRPWRKLKEAYRRKHPLCERCRVNGLVVESSIIHHKLERKARPDLELTWSNLEAVCDQCHNSHHKRKPRLDDGVHESPTLDGPSALASPS